MNHVREDALDIFLYALKTSRVEAAMERRVRFEDGVLRIDKHSYVLGRYDRLALIAIGKAGETMTRAFLRQAGDDAGRFEGIVVGPEGIRPRDGRLRVYGGGHPRPNEASVAAASDILATLGEMTERDLVI